MERLKEDLTRPLLAGENVEQKVERLMNERQTIYKLCPIQVDTDGKTIAQVAQEIIQKVSSTVAVLSQLVIGQPMSKLPRELHKFASSGTKVMVVADSAVSGRYGKRLQPGLKKAGFDAQTGCHSVRGTIQDARAGR